MCFNWVLIWPTSDLTGAKLDIPLENDIYCEQKEEKNIHTQKLRQKNQLIQFKKN